MLNKLIPALLVAVISSTLAFGQASMLPNAKQTFIDINGAPLALGTVDLYVPNTTTRKNTWTNSGETTLNTNPVALDGAGRAIIYGQGVYRQVVKDAAGNTQWDALTTGPSTGATSTFVTDVAPVGTMLPYAGIALPTNYLWAAGQAVSRTTYSELFNAITVAQAVTTIAGVTTLAGFSDTSQFKIGASVEGPCLPVNVTIASITNSTSIVVSAIATSSGVCTVRVFPFSNGDGSTTFFVPDMRGRVPAGRDNLNSIAASVLTGTYCPTGGTTVGLGLGSGCGNQSHTMSVAEMVSHLHTFTGDLLAGHTHATTVFSGAGPVNITAGAAGAFGFLTTTGAVTSTSVSGGTPSGTIGNTGNSAPFSIVQPTLVLNYIIKYQSSTPGGAGGVISLGGMTGDILCGAGMTCASNTVSITPGVGTGDVLGPSSAVNANFAMFNTTTGKLIADSGVSSTIMPTIPIIAPSSVGAPSSTGSGCNPTATAGPVLHHLMFTDQNWCTLNNLWSRSSIEPSALALWTVGGTITAGDVITMGFVQIKLPSPNVVATISYTVQAGDTTMTIAQGLVAAMKANPTLYTPPRGGYQNGAIFSYIPWLGNPQYPGGASDSQFAADYDAKWTLTWDYAVTGGNTETITSSAGWYTGAIYYGGTTAGAVNAQTVTATGFVDGGGVSVQFKAGLTNTAAMTLNVNGGGAINVQKYNNAGAIVNVVAGDVTTGNTYVVNRSQAVNSWMLGLNSTPLLAYSTKGPLAILPNAWDATFIDQPSRVTGTTSVYPQVSGAAPPGSPLWLLAPACENTDSTGILYGATGCGQFGPISMGLSHGAMQYGWLMQTQGSLWIIADGIFLANGCAYLFEPGCGLQNKGSGTINVNGYYAGNLAGLSVTKTVRAAGGAADCTQIFTGGILTGGSC